MVSRDDENGAIRTDGGISGVNDNEVVKQWMIYIVGLFAVYGIANVLDGFLITELLDASLSGMAGTSWGSDLIPLFLGVGVAAYSTRPDELVYKALGAGVAAGILVMAFVETSLYTSIILDNGSLDFAELLKYAIGEILCALFTVVGAVWLTRNQAPDELSR